MDSNETLATASYKILSENDFNTKTNRSSNTYHYPQHNNNSNRNNSSTTELSVPLNPNLHLRTEQQPRRQNSNANSNHSQNNTHSNHSNHSKKDALSPLNHNLITSIHSSHSCINVCCYHSYVYALIFMLVIPIIKLIVDIWTVVMYMSYDLDSNNDVRFIDTLGEDRVHLCGVLILCLVLFSTRCYLIFFCATMDNRSIFFDDDIVKNLYRIVPFLGAPVGTLIHDEYPTCSFAEFCQNFCIEVLLLMGIILTPWVMVYVLIRETRILKRYLYVQLISDGLAFGGNVGKDGMSVSHRFNHSQHHSSRSPSMMKPKSTMDSKLYEYQKFVEEKVEKYEIQLLLLKFSECLFSGLPQLFIQVYVFIEHSSVYEQHFTNECVFYISITVSIISILRFGHQCCGDGTPVQMCKKVFS